MGDSYARFRAAAVQAAPIFLDREKTIEKTVSLMKEAARNGASLVAFPEAYIPGYPYWVWIEIPLKGSDWFLRLHKNSIKVPGPHTEKLCSGAKEAGVYCVVGINEIDQVRFGTVYNTNLIIGPDGALLGKHRKIVATFAEKIVWGRGDGSSLRVYETELGRLGVLNCGENTNPLARFALLAQGEQVHVANYPALAFKTGYDMEHAVKLRSGAHAFEGKVFVITSSSTISPEMVEELCDTDEKRELMTGSGNAVSGIYNPLGECIGGPLIDEEGIVYADIDLEQTIPPKLMHDITGWYNRFDILSLNLYRQPQTPIIETGGDIADGQTIPQLKFLTEAMEAFGEGMRREIREALKEELEALKK